MQISQLIFSAGVVAWPLLLFSVLAIALISERSYFWLKILKKQKPIVRKAFNLFEKDWYSALGLLKKHPELPMCRIFLEALALDKPTPAKFRLALENAAQAELPSLRRFNTIFDTIITVSPLLGLLGTVLGLMASFSSLQLGNLGSSDTVGVTGGLSEALSSTVLGLIVAIFTLFFSNTFKGLYRRQVSSIQECTGRLELLQDEYYEQGLKIHETARK
ncbi:MotA/TolQ/ExbB proton channel family protein [Oscillatoriales cyanobacterium LEGE 11467]|uniref:MotA/TolQ/ExbB proton channel family protein n=1 Tax=Zarconia navalis LEGE 11467 TaxID=1828826 RepID=A0A928VW73_9CYAN|nr:MotA/TolQ/ExbB proton channel family protein [Zarconia navalis]MBE9040664.1 MotA/TolQ/ExbB proton channel family protein [Zarconia navalis LEGE 11467]